MLLSVASSNSQASGCKSPMSTNSRFKIRFRSGSGSGQRASPMNEPPGIAVECCWLTERVRGKAQTSADNWGCTLPSFLAHSCSSDGKLSNGAKIASIYLVFTIRILRNCCKRCAIIIALFTVGGVITMEMECLWLLYGVCRTQILPLLDPGV